MKLIIQVLVLVLGGPCVAKSVGDCKSSCQSIRSKVLNDVSSSVCKKAANIAPIPQLFQACIEGRKKAFDQCVSMCSNGAQKSESDSFESCKKVMKNGNARPKITQWCRQGYDEILSGLEVRLRQQSKPSKHSLVESVEVAINDDVDTDFSEYEAPESEVDAIAVEEELVQAISNEQFEQEVPISIAGNRNLRSDDAAMSDKEDKIDSFYEM
eukprot:CCRYP_001003-RB/>CCRYP_001003-RB protein AED:0.29 eAED:0.29 QI:53/1/1/1/0.33/0.28/7/2832/211